MFSGLRPRPWVLHRMVQAEAKGALAEWRAEYRGRGWSSKGGACRGHGRQLERGLERFVCQSRLVDPLGCCVPGLRISVCRLSEGHSSDLTLDVQFESAVTPQANFPQKITFDTLYTNEFVIRVRSRALSIPSERTTI